MDPRAVALDSVPEVRRVASRRMGSIVRTLQLEAGSEVRVGSGALVADDHTRRDVFPTGSEVRVGSEALAPADHWHTGAGAFPAPSVALATGPCIDRSLRNFVPRCGQTRPVEHGDERSIIPRAPIGVPLEPAPPAGAPLTPQQHQHRQDRVRLENSRVKKWLAMLAKPRESPRNKELLKKRCRKGIPDSIRGAAWFYLVDGEALRARADASYDELLELQLPLAFIESLDAAASRVGSGAVGSSGSTSAIAAAPVVAPGAGGSAPDPPAPARAGRPLRVIPESAASLVEVIERDINRTFPSHGLFAETGGVGQIALFRILVCYLHLDAEIGYCQGMGFLAAMLLCYMPEEDAFWSFCSIMRGGAGDPSKPPRHNMRAMFASGLPRVPVVAHVLQGAMNRALPRVAAHLLRFDVHPPMYATQWFMTLFTYTLPFDAAVRVWDAFLCEGWKAVYRASLAMLHALEPRLLAARDFEQTVLTFRRLGEPGCVAPDALGLVKGPTRLRRKELDALEAEYAMLEAAGLPTADARAGSWPRDAAAATRVLRNAETRR